MSVQGAFGNARANIVVYIIRQATTLRTGSNLFKLLALSNWRSSILQPLLSTLCQISICHRQAYHFTRSRAFAVVFTGTVVKSIHSTTSTPSGGFGSMTQTAHTETDGNFSASRCFGGQSWIAFQCISTKVWRAACFFVLGICSSKEAATGVAANAAHRYWFSSFSTRRSLLARISKSTPGGRGTKNRSYTSASRSPILTNCTSGINSCVAITLSRLTSHLLLSFSSIGRCL